jgi:hypothetical protein
MKNPYWQITIETPRLGCAESTLEQDKDKAMDVLFEKAKSLLAGQTAYLYKVDESGFVCPEYTITRK